MLSKIQKRQKGQTIIEAMVALAIILLIVTAISIVIVNGLYNSSFIKSQNEANKYAQQGIETVRNIQRNNLEVFREYVNSGGTYCIDETTGTLTTLDCQNTGINIGNAYNRTIQFSPGGGQCDESIDVTKALKVTVTVSWSSSKCPQSNTFCHTSELVSCMPYVYPASNP